MFFYLYISGFCIFIVKFGVFFQKTMYSFVSNDCASFFKFSFFDSCEMLCFICVWKRIVILFSFLRPLIFYRVASINSVQATDVHFLTFWSSTLPIRLVFDNLLKNLIICSQHLDVCMISNWPFTTVPQVIVKVKPNSSIYTQDSPRYSTLGFQLILF